MFFIALCCEGKWQRLEATIGTIMNGASSLNRKSVKLKITDFFY